MKKYIYIAMLLCVGMLGACVEDKGSYDYIELNDLTIEPLEESYTVEQFTNLQIPTTITARDGAFNPDGYDYKWIIYSQHNNQFKTDTISTEKDLDAEVTSIPGNYRLYYEVKDKETDVIYTQNAALEVINSYSKGMMILSRVGDDANLAFVNVIDNVIEDAYQKVNGEPAGKNPVGIRYVAGMLSSAEKMVVIMTDDERGGTVVAPLDLSYVMDFGDLFYFPPENIKPQAFGTHDYSAFEYVICDGSIYTRKVLGTEGYAQYGVRIKGEYDYIAPFDFFKVGSNPQVAYFYDQGRERFVSMSVPLQGESVIPLVDQGGAFNPNNVAMQMLWGGLFGSTSAMNNGRAVMEDDGGKRYTISFTISSDDDGNALLQPQYKYEITAEGIDEATSFTTSQSANFLYYSTGNKIVCVSFSTNNQMNVYEFPEGQQVDYIECDQKGNANELWVGLSDGSATAKSGTVVVLTMSTDGSLTESRRYENICGQVVDFEYKN